MVLELGEVFRDRLPEDALESALEHAGFGEPCLAFEFLLDRLSEHEVAVSGPEWQRLADIAGSWGGDTVGRLLLGYRYDHARREAGARIELRFDALSDRYSVEADSSAREDAPAVGRLREHATGAVLAFERQPVSGARIRHWTLVPMGAHADERAALRAAALTPSGIWTSLYENRIDSDLRCWELTIDAAVAPPLLFV